MILFQGNWTCNIACCCASLPRTFAKLPRKGADEPLDRCERTLLPQTRPPSVLHTTLNAKTMTSTSRADYEPLAQPQSCASAPVPGMHARALQDSHENAIICDRAPSNASSGALLSPEMAMSWHGVINGVLGCFGPHLNGRPLAGSDAAAPAASQRLNSNPLSDRASCQSYDIMGRMDSEETCEASRGAVYPSAAVQPQMQDRQSASSSASDSSMAEQRQNQMMDTEAEQHGCEDTSSDEVPLIVVAASPSLPDDMARDAWYVSDFTFGERLYTGYASTVYRVSGERQRVYLVGCTRWHSHYVKPVIAPRIQSAYSVSPV